MPLSVLLLIYSHGGRVKAPLTLNAKWQIWIMRRYKPTNINRWQGGLAGAKSRGCWRPESADYTPEALDNAHKCASLKAWNPWSIRADLSFAINIPSCLCCGGHPCTVLMWQSPEGTTTVQSYFSSCGIGEDVITKETIKGAMFLLCMGYPDLLIGGRQCQRRGWFTRKTFIRNSNMLNKRS